MQKNNTKAIESIEPKARSRDHLVVAISAALQSLPYTGGLARYLDEYYPSQQKRLLLALAKEIKQQAAMVTSVSCDLDRLAATVNQVIFESIKTTSEHKRSALRCILLNYASGKSIEDRKLEYFLQTLSNITELQLQILKLAVDPQKAFIDFTGIPESKNVDLKAVSIDDMLGSIPELSWPAYNDLVMRVLLKHTTFFNEKPGARRMPLSRLVISDLGKEFLSWIKFANV